MPKPRKDQDEKIIELVPNAWARFERFVKDIAKAGPQHRVAKTKPHKPHDELKAKREKRNPAKGKVEEAAKNAR